MSEPTGPTAPSSTCPFRGTGSLSYGEEHTAAHHGRTSQIKAHPRRARQAYRRHRRDRSRPWRAPDPGAIDEELKNGGSWPTSRPSRLPGAAAASSARAGFSSACYGVPSEPVKAVKVTPLRRPAASSTPRPTTAAKFPFPPRAREPRRAAAASVFDVGAPGFSGLSPDSE